MNFSRRQLLAAAGSAALLAACGEDSKSGASTTLGNAAPTDGTGAPAGGWAIVQRFPNHPLFTPGEVRLPISLADQTRMLDNGPAKLTGWIEDFNGTRITDITGIRRGEGLPTPYWEVRATLQQAVIHTMRFEGDDGYGATFELFDPSDVKTPPTGTALPPFDTPTKDDHRGVEPYCSLTPKPCPLHDVTLRDALATGKPVAYMVGTPAHCTTGTCTPGLQFLVGEHERVGDEIVMVHADVYADAEATEVSPAVTSLGALYEPIIYFCTADGVIVDRLDGVWDRSELTERVDALLAR
ncbi:MAG: hypothetical protein WCC60_10380 [Ilumatobacteraceae bacterium]